VRWVKNLTPICVKPMLGTIFIMEIYGTIIQKVIINPLLVMKELYENELYWRHRVFEKDGKYYEWWEEGAGSHSIDKEKEISKERYEYIQALKIVISKLEKDDKI
jgi:hypothetical protein